MLLGVSPGEISSFRDDPIVRLAQESSGQSQTTPDGGTWREQNERQNHYLEDKKKNQFQLNTYVYLDLKTKTFSKSFEDQVS